MQVATHKTTGRPVRLRIRPVLRDMPVCRRRHLYLPPELKKELLRAQTAWLTRTRFRISRRAVAASLSINAVVAVAAFRGVQPGASTPPPAIHEVVLIKPMTFPPELLNPPKLDAIPRSSITQSSRTEPRTAPQLLESPPLEPALGWLSAAPSPAIIQIAATCCRPRETIPDSGAGDGQPAPVPAVDAAYWQGVRDRVAGEVRYPLSARRRNVAGEVVLCVAVNARGELVVVKPVPPAADPDLSEAAVSATRRAAPFPPPPAMRGVETNVAIALIPIHFVLVEKEKPRKE